MKGNTEKNSKMVNIFYQPFKTRFIRLQCFFFLFNGGGGKKSSDL